MLPVIPAAENIERSSKKSKRCKNKLDRLDPRGGSHELVAIRRASTIKTDTTLIENSDACAVKEPAYAAQHHQCNMSLIVDFDLAHMSRQLLDGVISDLDLALFAFWIKAKNENHLMAKEVVRELGLDQVHDSP